MRTLGGSRMVLIAIGAVVAVLIGVAVVIALQPPRQFDPTTPEGAAQGYFQGLHDDDAALVASYLTEDLRDRCSASAFLEDFTDYGQPETVSVSIISTEVDGDSARVKVTITVTYGDAPFTAGQDRFDDTLVMERDGDRWLISEPAWPLDRYMCESGG